MTLLAGALELEQEDGVLAPGSPKQLEKLGLLDLNRNRVFAGSVDDGGDPAALTELAVVALAGLLSGLDLNSCFTHDACYSLNQTNSELTELWS